MNENEIKFQCTQNLRCLATTIYDDRPIYKSRTVLFNDNTIHVPVATALLVAKHSHNDLAKKSDKAHIMPVVPVATPLKYVCL